MVPYVDRDAKTQRNFFEQYKLIPFLREMEGNQFDQSTQSQELITRKDIMRALVSFDPTKSMHSLDCFNNFTQDDIICKKNCGI